MYVLKVYVSFTFFTLPCAPLKYFYQQRSMMPILRFIMDVYAIYIMQAYMYVCMCKRFFTVQRSRLGLLIRKVCTAAALLYFLSFIKGMIQACMHGHTSTRKLCIQNHTQEILTMRMEWWARG